jgi:hypothetical protein
MMIHTGNWHCGKGIALDVCVVAQNGVHHRSLDNTFLIIYDLGVVMKRGNAFGSACCY